ncbi:MAG: helix-turn-helix domain-containing protein, partial [Gemmatimonadota bacterium]
KLKRLRQSRRLTLNTLSSRAGLSISYLAEIESGKKFPKTEKILGLAEALGTSYDELISSRVDDTLAPLRDYLAAPALIDFPFERFGLPRDQLVHLLSRSPTEVSALLRTLNDIGRQYNIGVEHFLHAALRSYQELTANYYEDLEAAAEAFTASLGVKAPHPGLVDQLTAAVEREFGVAVDTTRLPEHAALSHVRAVLVPTARPVLYLNPVLTPSQRAYLLAREAAYRRLGLKARSYVSPPDRSESFDQVLNDFKASYFAGAVLMPRQALVAEVKRLFRQPRWHPEGLLALLERYAVTAETLMYRLSQVVPGEFGLNVHFLKFREEDGDYRLVKQLNLSQLPIPPGHSGGEHYCRRWLTTRLLQELSQWQHRNPEREAHPVLGVQLSRFVDGTDEFFCLGLSQPTELRRDTNMSLTLGFRVDEAFTKTVRFARDRTIPRTVISTTCERCPLEPAACRDRVAPPAHHLATEARAAQATAVLALREEAEAR